MPKLLRPSSKPTEPVAPVRPGTETFLTQERTKLGGPYSDYGIYSKRVQCTTVATIQERYAKATPRERAEIIGFVQANTQDRLLVYAYWFLTTYKNLDTGRTYLAAGCSETEPGVTVKEIRKLVGLKELKTSQKK